MAPTTSLRSHEKRSSSSKRAYSTSAHHVPLHPPDLKPILESSATPEQAQEAWRRMKKMRVEGRKKYDSSEDRWLNRLNRYLKFYDGRKTASGWPITPYKFRIWAAHDPRPTYRSVQTYLDTLESARAATSSFFLAAFPALPNRRLHDDPEVRRVMRQFEIQLAEPSASASTKKNKPQQQQPPAASSSAQNLKPSSIKDSSSTKNASSSVPKRKLSAISDSSRDSSQPLWNQPRPASMKPKTSKKLPRIDHQSHDDQKKSSKGKHHTKSSARFMDPFSERICVFSDLKIQHIQDSFLDSFRRYHPSVRSIKEEIEELEEDIEDLTSETGELAQIASKEVLTICLESYLEFWQERQISGFPIQAIKLCVWFDSMQVNRKEAIDIAVGFERLGKRVEDQVDEHPPRLFESPGPLAQSALWISFLDHFGWRADPAEAKPPAQRAPHEDENDDNEEDEEKNGDDDGPEEEQDGSDDDRDMQLQTSSPPALPTPSLPLTSAHDHANSAVIQRQISISIGSSLSSLPQSPSPLLPRADNSAESQSTPGAHSEHSDKDHRHSIPPTHVWFKQMDDAHHPAETLHQHPDDPELARFRYKRALVKSSEHRQFLANLRRFVNLL